MATVELPDAVADPAGHVLAAADLREKRATAAHPINEQDRDDDIGWWVDNDAGCLEPDDPREPLIRGGDNEIVGSALTLAATEHIAAEANPAHALAEVALWRGIVERHRKAWAHEYETVTCWTCDSATPIYPCPDLLAVVAAARAYLGGQ